MICMYIAKFFQIRVRALCTCERACACICKRETRDLLLWGINLLFSIYLRMVWDIFNLLLCFLVNRALVEQLAKVNPVHLDNDEKLAFWINLYNAMIMHVCTFL